jgi:hypothetical protein
MERCPHTYHSCAGCGDKARRRAARAQMDDHMIRARLAAMHPRRPEMTGWVFWAPVLLMVGVGALGALLAAL